MRYRFQYRRYRLPFRTAVRTAHGLWVEREGIIVRLTPHDEGKGEGARNRDGQARVGSLPDTALNLTRDFLNPARPAGFGEAAPVPEFGLESVDELEAACREVGEWSEAERLLAAAERLPCLRHAITAALHEVGRVFDPHLRGEVEGGSENLPSRGVQSAERRVETPPYLGVAALLPAGKAALAQIGPKAEIGFRVFKWKVGVGDLADELALLDDVCARLPSGAKLRLDANGAWDRRKAERWLERCADRPVEFVEQPALAAGAATGTSAQKKVDDLLLGLAGDFPTTLALDESLVGDGDVEKWIGAGWPGVFVVKPSLFADLSGALTRLEKAKADVVFSSALETAIGARSALQTAFSWNGRRAGDAHRAVSPSPNARTDGAAPPMITTLPTRAVGFGVYPLFHDPRFDAPHAMPFVRWEDVERIDTDAVWAALGS